MKSSLEKLEIEKGHSNLVTLGWQMKPYYITVKVNLKWRIRRKHYMRLCKNIYNKSAAHFGCTWEKRRKFHVWTNPTNEHSIMFLGFGISKLFDLLLYLTSFYFVFSIYAHNFASLLCQVIYMIKFPLPCKVHPKLNQKIKKKNCEDS